MNTTTQQQMTTERSAPGLSLLASRLLASLQGTAMTAFKRISKAQRNGQQAAASLLDAALNQRARFVRHHEPVQASFCGYQWQHAHHIRGGNP